VFSLKLKKTKYGKDSEFPFGAIFLKLKNYAMIDIRENNKAIITGRNFY
jgi:hypothetical protein